VWDRRFTGIKEERRPDWRRTRDEMGDPRMHLRSLAATLVATTAVALGVAGSATAAPSWAPASSATIHPGVQTETQSGQCTSNFVFYDAADNVYLGQAAHCSGEGGQTETDGCTTQTLGTGIPVAIEGASRPGSLAYSSWVTMKSRGERNEDTCRYNDFALVKVDPADAGKVNPSVPFWGGPTGLNTTGSPPGETVLSYGNSKLWPDVESLKRKRGTTLTTTGNGWSHVVLTLTPGIPGDSGSAVLDSSGRALGVLSTLNLLPLPGTNGVGDLSRELAYLEAHSGMHVTLANGTEPFQGP
jgi:trypsin-like peptidase